jgi:hypothetical protein
MKLQNTLAPWMLLYVDGVLICHATSAFTSTRNLGRQGARTWPTAFIHAEVATNAPVARRHFVLM